MLTVVRRVVGALLALAGLALTALGVWFATQLGSSGTAEFTVRPDGAEPVVIRPDVLNRVDADVVVTATPAAGTRAWMALANPSDATAVLGDARHTEVTGVEVQDWLLTTATRGSGPASEGLGTADLWRQQDDAEGPVTLTVQQDEAPETLVATTDGAPLQSLTLTITDKTWFVEAVVAALVGLFVLVVGVLLLWPRRASREGDEHHLEVAPPVPARSDAEQTVALPRDPEEAAR
ncbi:hypothetical protein ACK8HX_00765 [Oryzobacter sp. R7]|uniref:hypothetical protein n=1 Tax=Oryzobacter faecalis TaxID=3388656 RepID=UPI00398D052F